MKFGSCFAGSLGQEGVLVNKSGIPKMARLSPQLKHRIVAGGAATLLAFAVGLLVAALGAWAADEPARSRPTTERAGTDSARAQPTAQQSALPNQPSSSASDANYIDQLYRQLIGPQPAAQPDPRSSTPPAGRGKR
jgi:hypothetical protein